MGGGGKKETTTNTDMGPWGPQQDYLKSAFTSAQTIYNSLDARGPYKGEFVAAPTADQYDQAKRGVNYANTTGYNNIMDLIGSGDAYGRAGYGVMTDASKGLNDFNNADTLGQTISGANRVREGFDVPGAVKAAMADANYQAATDTLPSLYRNAAATGNINSSRAALADGVVRAKLADTAGNISANLNNSNYKTGLDTTAQSLAQRLQGLSQLGSLGGSMGNIGLGATTSGLDAANKNFGLGKDSANAVQELDQSKLNNDKAKYQNVNDFYWNNLNNMMGIVGSNNWGQKGTTTETTKNTPSTMSTIGSALGAVGGLLKK